MVVTFDFDNTIALSHMVFDANGDVTYEFDGYNNVIVDKIKQHITDGDEIYIVTARVEANEGMFPDDTIPKHLHRLGLQGYFLPDRLYYTNSQPKIQLLKRLGSQLHWDDNIEEMISLKSSSIRYENPFDTLPDSQVVGKVMIFDQDDKVLLLQRSDAGQAWDLPGGHMKEIEVSRGEYGRDEGIEREVAEETGLLLPFQKQIGRYNFAWKGKDHDIYIYMSKIDEKEPEVDLTMQDFEENIDYVWATLPQLEEFLPKSTQIVKKAAEFLPKDELFEQGEPFQRAMKKKHFTMKKRLIGLGDNKDSGGGKGHKRPSFERSKSAPPMAEEQETKKKRTIKVKITPKLDEKRKKRTNKRKKTVYPHKKRKYAYYGGYIPYDFGGSDGGGDGGGGE